MPDIYYTEADQTAKKRYRGESEATENEKAAVGGEKTLQIGNYLFQADVDAQAIADALLARLKNRKDYFEATTEFCPVPLERGDTIQIEEHINPTTNLIHVGLVRQLRLSITPSSQTLTITIED